MSRLSDDFYKIINENGVLSLFEVEDNGAYEQENLDENEELQKVNNSDNYILKEAYSAFVEVKVFAPTPQSFDEADIFYVIDKYYTDFNGLRIGAPLGEGGDDIGGNDDDDCDGDDSDNVLRGLGGNDRLRGYKGRDQIFGGQDDDYLDSGDDADMLDGGDGGDILCGGRGEDIAKGGRGDDIFLDGNESGDDHYIGGAGINEVRYNMISGTSVFANLQTGRAVVAGQGSDKLRSIQNITGGDSDDVLFGSAKSNKIDGGIGDDRLNGLQGIDRYIGGLGADTFVFSKAKDTGLGAKADVITDFSASEFDKIDLSAIDAKKGFGKNDDFTFIGSAPSSSGSASAGVIWTQAGYLFASVDKDASAEFSIKVLPKDFLASGLLSESDFIL